MLLFRCEIKSTPKLGLTSAEFSDIMMEGPFNFKIKSTPQNSVDLTIMSHLKQNETGWLAGIIDGEGCIGIYYHTKKDKYTLQIVVNMCHEATIKRFRKLIGTGSCRQLNETRKNWRSAWSWRAEQKDAIFVLSLLKDEIFTKKEHVETALKFGELLLVETWTQEHKDKALKLCALMSVLNERGR